jgi:ankyrin repeat protein
VTGHSDLSRDQVAIALLASAVAGKADEVGRILDIYPDIIDERGLLPGHTGMRTALHFAANGPHEAVIRLLLERADDVRRLLAKDPEGLTLGHRWGTLIIRASEHASGQVIEKLIALGASVDAQDDRRTAVDETSRYTALDSAAWHGNLEAINVLLRHGANPRIRDEKYCATPAGWAAYAGQLEARDLILAGPF